MNKTAQTLLIIVVVLIIGFLGYSVLTAPDNRTTGERIGDAIDVLPEGGPGRAVDELGDKTPGERIGDAVEDAGRNVREATDGDGR